MGFSDGPALKNLPAVQETWETWIPSLGREDPLGQEGSPGVNLLQCSCLGNPMDRGAWWATDHGNVEELDTTEWLNTHRVCQADGLSNIDQVILYWLIPDSISGKTETNFLSQFGDVGFCISTCIWAHCLFLAILKFLLLAIFLVGLKTSSSFSVPL